MASSRIMAKVNSPQLEHVKKCFEELKSVYFKLQNNQRLYLYAGIALVTYLACSAFLSSEKSQPVLLLFWVFWILAIAYDVSGLYKKVYETTIGKAIFILLLSLLTNFAIALAAQAVNDIAGIDPSKFPHTIAFVSMLSIPIFVSIGLAIIGFLLLIVTPFVVMFHATDDGLKKALIPGYESRKEIPFLKFTQIVQFFSLMIFSLVVGKYAQHGGIDEYQKLVMDQTRTFLFEFEMYAKAPCEIEPKTRVSFLGENKVLLGTKGPQGITFRVQECVAKKLD